MARIPREGFYTMITKGFKGKIVKRITKKGRTIKYFIEGFYLMSETEFQKVFEVVDKAQEREAETNTL